MLYILMFLCLFADAFYIRFNKSDIKLASGGVMSPTADGRVILDGKRSKASTRDRTGEGGGGGGGIM